MTIHPWFWAHVFATLAMVGLIWTIQLVHYPLMAEVRNGFVNYHDQHCARIAWLVGPLMGVEALTGLLLLYERPPGVGQVPVWVGFLLIGPDLGGHGVPVRTRTLAPDPGLRRPGNLTPRGHQLDPHPGLVREGGPGALDGLTWTGPGLEGMNSAPQVLERTSYAPSADGA